MLLQPMHHNQNSFPIIFNYLIKFLLQFLIQFILKLKNIYFFIKKFFQIPIVSLVSYFVYFLLCFYELIEPPFVLLMINQIIAYYALKTVFRVMWL